jgi:glycosyltransferase involved in cell wall biosynthesis
MKILRVIASVDPATGGPVAGMRAITPVLTKLGHQTDFLTVDDPFAGYLQSWVGQTFAMGPAPTSYAYARRVRPWLEKNISRYDAVIVHGLWQYLGLAVRSVTRARGGPPYFVIPHGMLDPSVRSTYPVKHVKKWLYWQVAERRILRDARAVLFTCQEERRLARKTFPFYQCNERVIAYGAARPEGSPDAWSSAWRNRSPSSSTHRYFLFLGRIHSKKGIELLLRAYGKITRTYAVSHGGTPPDLVIAGPCVDDRYLATLKTLAQAEGIGASVHWPGMLTGDAKWGALANAEAFVLPSYQENFGIAVVEALACGTPVLISNRVNIWSELDADDVALVEPPTQEGITRLLERWLLLTADARTKMGDAARASFEKRFEIGFAAQHLTEQLSSLLSQRTAPAR